MHPALAPHAKLGTGHSYMLSASRSLSDFDETLPDSARHKGHLPQGKFMLWVGLANTIELFQACIAGTS
ncbi:MULTISPECIES: hypothetical protein [Mesorhizobium]|uniref:hypothetical protein n=1 Tax=Mesorhizobium TaxID=68287 RepID=UPI001140C669|nr:MULTISPECIES: hypothetical protein [Mesorhizobium]